MSESASLEQLGDADASRERTDAANEAFYGRFPFPWQPRLFRRVEDTRFWSRMLCQDLGLWGRDDLLPPGSRIWVAGCGTNQAVQTALRFPDSHVTGSDLSGPSLALARKSADALGLRNLELVRESINDVSYAESFDYAICTGVVHHNSDPKHALECVTRALKPAGLLELMVYNRFHRMQTSAFQEALRLLGHGSIDFDAAIRDAKAVMRGFRLPGNGRPVIDVVGANLAALAAATAGGDRSGGRPGNAMAELLDACRGIDDAALADALAQPVENSYSVSSLGSLCRSVGLDLVAPCLNTFDRVEQRISWNLEFDDSALQDRYLALPDQVRWQLTNLLLGEQSPRLWFYVQREDCGREIPNEQGLAEELLDRELVKNAERVTTFLRGEAGAYRPGARVLPFPGAPRGTDLASRVFELHDDGMTLRTLLRSVDVPAGFLTAHELRMSLATSAHPYLRALEGRATRSVEEETIERVRAGSGDEQREEDAEVELRGFARIDQDPAELHRFGGEELVDAERDQDQRQQGPARGEAEDHGRTGGELDGAREYEHHLRSDPEGVREIGGALREAMELRDHVQADADARHRRPQREQPEVDPFCVHSPLLSTGVGGRPSTGRNSSIRMESTRPISPST